jgi:toxin-antitoxin system PIN domain toxin
MAFLADVNLLVALLHARHSLAHAAADWVDRQATPSSILLCRVAQMGVLRILTNPAWMKEDTLTAARVWSAWERLLGDERFAASNEPTGIDREWRRVTESLPAGKCAETDAYLAAFAIAGGHRIATFDRGFRRFRGVDVELLG